jgi:hypothetical protein
VDGKKNIGTVRSRKPDGTVTEAGRDGHGTVTVSGQKRKIYCIKKSHFVLKEGMLLILCKNPKEILIFFLPVSQFVPV